MSTYKIKFTFDIDLKTIRQASAIMDLDVPTNDQIADWLIKDENEFPKEMVSKEFEFIIACAFVLANTQEDLNPKYNSQHESFAGKRDKSEDKPKSKFRQRLEEAQRLQSEKQ